MFSTVQANGVWGLWVTSTGVTNTLGVLKEQEEGCDIGNCCREAKGTLLAALSQSHLRLGGRTRVQKG